MGQPQGEGHVRRPLLGDRLDGRYTNHRLHRVDRPTTLITSQVTRFDEREHGFFQTLRGDYGPVPQREFLRFVDKYPLSGAIKAVEHHLVEAVDGAVAATKAPLPDDPAVMSRHLKQTALFLRADDVGVCELPPYAVYSTDKNGAAVELGHTHAIAVLVDQGYPSFATAGRRDSQTSPQGTGEFRGDPGRPEPGMTESEGDDALSHEHADGVGHAGTPALPGPEHLQATAVHLVLPAIVGGRVHAERPAGGSHASQFMRQAKQA